MTKEPWKLAAWVAAGEAALLAVAYLFLWAFKPDVGYHGAAWERFVAGYLRLHAPLAPGAFEMARQALERDPDQWPYTRVIMLPAVHLAALLNTFLLAAAGGALWSRRRLAAAPGLTAAQRYALARWARHGGTEPFVLGPPSGARARQLLGEALNELTTAIDSSPTRLEDCIQARERCLRLLPVHAREAALWEAIGEATLNIEDRGAPEPDEEAMAFGRACLAKAQALGMNEPRLWSALLRWGLDADARDNAAKRLSRLKPEHPLLLLGRIIGDVDRTPEQRRASLGRSLPYMTESLIQQALILDCEGRPAEAAEAWEALRRQDPGDMRPWRAKRVLSGGDASAPAAPAPGRPQPAAWLYGAVTAGSPAQGGAWAWLAFPLLALLWLWWPRLMAWQERSGLPGQWVAVAMVRYDGSRIPLADLPFYYYTVDRDEQRDYGWVAKLPGPVELQLKEDGSAQVQPPAGPGTAVTWSYGPAGLELGEPAGKWQAHGALVDDGLEIRVDGHAIPWLMQRAGQPPLPVQYADWSTAPLTVNAGDRYLVRKRQGGYKVFEHKGSHAWRTYVAMNQRAPLPPLEPMDVSGTVMTRGRAPSLFPIYVPGAIAPESLALLP